MLNRWMKTGGDYSGHAGERNRGDEEVWVSMMLRRNAERQMVANCDEQSSERSMDIGSHIRVKGGAHSWTIFYAEGAI